MSGLATKSSNCLSASRNGRQLAVPVVCGLRFFSKLPQQVQSQRVSVARPKLASQLSLLGVQHIVSKAATITAAPPAPGQATAPAKAPFKYHGVHHVALLVKNLERSLEFYQGVLDLPLNPDRPHGKLPYRGAWLWIGPEMIHLMELDNPDPLAGRPEHGGRDRHVCVGVTDIKPLVEKLQAAGIPYTTSMSGRPAVFFRDPDMNCLEVVEQEPWR